MDHEVMKATAGKVNSERERRRLALSKALAASGRSRRRAAHEIARTERMNPQTLETNFKRWLAETPRPGAIDAAPDWAIEATKALKPLSALTLSDELREALAHRNVSLILVRRAADALAALGR